MVLLVYLYYLKLCFVVNLYMNQTCQDAYSIFCLHNRSKNSEKIEYALRILKVYKKKIIIYQNELMALSAYIEYMFAKEKLSEYEKFIILQSIFQLSVTDSIGNRPIYERLFNAVVNVA